MRFWLCGTACGLVLVAMGSVAAENPSVQSAAPATEGVPALPPELAPEPAPPSPASAPGPLATGPQEPPSAPSHAPTLETDVQRVSYAIGVQMGRQVLRSVMASGYTLDVPLVVKGVQDGLGTEAPAMNTSEVGATISLFWRTIATRQQEKEAATKAFFEENAKKEGVVALPGGLQFKVVRDGTGRIPALTDIVRVNYRGAFLNGEEFQNTFEFNAPADVSVSAVIPGWSEALQRMREGARWELFIPAALAYGAKGSLPGIGPNEALIFEVELIEIVSEKVK